MYPIEFTRVWKHYRLNQQYDSLRDAIPMLVKRLIGRNGHPEVDEGFWALRDVTFRVAKGETLGIIGPNGAGKSTVLKLLSRITRQTRGSLRIHGRFAALIELGGGFHPDLTGAENIYLQGTMLGLSRREIDRDFDSIVAFSELGEFLAMPVKRYSSGMVVRLGFGIAAHIQPDVLLIDEVLAVGDLAFQQKCFKRIAELKRQGTTMIFISHDLSAVGQLCDRVLLLRKGQAVCDGSPRQVIRRYRDEVLTSQVWGGDSTTKRPNGPLHLVHIALQDVRGQSIASVESGQSFRVEVAYHATRPIRRPVFNIWVERSDGLLCHTASSRQVVGAPEVVSGDGRLSVLYASMNLLANTYQLSVEVCEDGNPIPVALAEPALSFAIGPDHNEPGVVQLDCRWLFNGTRERPLGPGHQSLSDTV